MVIPAHILRQLGHPSGFTGRLILRLLNHVNKNMNHHALQALKIGAQDRILEIGFGGGGLAANLLAEEAGLHLTGCDISELAVKKAQRRFAAYPHAGFDVVSAEALPYSDGSFTKVVAVNVIYFWQNIPATLREIFRVCQAGGQVVLCYSELGPDEVRLFRPAELETQLHAAGFGGVVSTAIATDDTDSHFCTVAIKEGLTPAG